MARASLKDRADLQLSHRKNCDRSIVLVLIGLLALMPPMAGLVETDTAWGGVPLALIYVFLVWLVLIAGALFLARRLRDGDDTLASQEPVDGGS